MNERKRTIVRYLFSLTILGLCFGSCSAKTEMPENENNFVSFSPTGQAFQLAKENTVAPIIIHHDEYPGVVRAANYFKNDLKMVTGADPEVLFNDIPAGTSPVIIGTLGKSPLIGQLVKNKKIDVSDIEGKWEASLIQVVENPFEGVDKALVIAGSDKRGTIFGIFDISRKMGVSPWYWWADVPVKKHDNIYVKAGRYNLGEPKVKYRGIFLNDEEPALGRWAVEKYGGFNHGMYEKVFELILRLKGNYLWPAMWWASFNSDDPQNPALADEMGIVISTTHHEPMMRAHAEWKPWGGKEWNYSTNSEQLREFWREGIERMGSHESIVTLAMRGDGDVGMEANANVALLEKVVSDQRKIIEEVTGKPAAETPQVWALYKEVQEYYDKGMRVPDDVTLLLCDDNWGNVRYLPNLDSPPRKGGYGMYYHFDFVGGPRNYKWINTSPLPRVWEQMNLTYRYGVDRIWLVNVGDLKPMELPISFFLDFAWDPDRIPAEKLDEYTSNWAKEQFGEKYAKDAAEVLDLYTKYNGRRTPEMLYSDTYSLTSYREFERVTADYRAITEKAEKMYDSMPEELQPAFYQLVLHPAKACANLYEMYYALALNKLYAQQSRATANKKAGEVAHYYLQDSLYTVFYHNLLNGKWNHMMAQPRIGYTYWQQPPQNRMPAVTEIRIPEQAAMGISVEGSDETWPGSTNEAVLPEFDSFNEQNFYIEVFNKGTEAFHVELKSDKDWVKFSKTNETISDQDRFEITVDWEKAEEGLNTAEISVEPENGVNQIVKVKAEKYNNVKPKGFVERNAYVSIEASDFTKKRDGNQINWFVIPGLGRTGSGVTTSPVTKSVQAPGPETPWLEYDFFLLQTPENGTVEVEIHLAPTLNFKNGDGLKFAVSVDDAEPQIINMHEGTEVPDWKYPSWFNDAVGNKVMVKRTVLQVQDSGAHTLHVWMIDNGIVFQKIIIDNGGLKASYLGPPESLKL